MKTGPQTAHRPIKTGLYQSGPVKGIFGPVLDRSRSQLSPIWVEKLDQTGLLNTTLEGLSLDKYILSMESRLTTNGLSATPHILFGSTDAILMWNQ